MSDRRTETDSMGEVQVEHSKYWGAQTQRALHHFAIGNDLVPPELISALALLKKAAALANHQLGKLAPEKTTLIVQAAEEVMAAKLDEHFPLHVWMSGSGTQANMNVNEVIANRAIELSGGVLGSKRPIHPNDDVNMSQSTNDVFPSAMHIVAATQVKQRLLPAVTMMQQELATKAQQWQDVIKIGRTHMQDAVPITLGQEFSGYAQLLQQDLRRIEAALDDVYELAIGGTAVGTGLNVVDGYASKVCAYVAQSTGLPFVEASNKFALQGSHDALVALMSQLKVLAVSLFKIASDIRLLSCGPRAGLYELILPENEPGSSIMPGKVNPTQCEAMTMVAAQVMGYDAAVAVAGSAGNLEMNAYKPMIIFNLLQSVRCLSDSCVSFSQYLLQDLQPNVQKIAAYMQDSLMLVTALTPLIGYDKSAQMAQWAHANHCSLAEANAHFGFLSPEEFAQAINPAGMV